MWFYRGRRNDESAVRRAGVRRRGVLERAADRLERVDRRAVEVEEDGLQVGGRQAAEKGEWSCCLCPTVVGTPVVRLNCRLPTADCRPVTPDSL